MFTIDDLWRILKFLKDGTTDPKLSELTTTLATSEKEITNTFFEQILDQPTFKSNDYRKLRSMLIDLYSSHKTIAATQKNVSDIHQLPNEHLSELFKSFGFPIGLNLVPLTSKANFFLDLVNFYKKKGTPETLVDVLDYYGFSDTDLIEYWLQKDQYGELIFRGESVRLAATGSTLLLETDVPFEKITVSDPHWMQSKDDILSMVDTKTINLPSKSPYFSLSSIFSLFNINISLSIVFRIVEDQYDRYMTGLELPYNIPVKNLGTVLPILHIYVATIYTFERLFGYGSDTNFERYSCFNGTINYKGSPPIAYDLSKLSTQFQELIERPNTQADRTTRLQELFSQWSRPMSQSFLNSINASESLLDALNPEFKSIIDSWFDVGDQNYLMTYLLGTIDNWIRINIDSKSPSLVITMLGLSFRKELNEIINFFKPYRARLAFMDTAYSIKNPLSESVLIDEWILTRIEQNHHNNHIRPSGGYCRPYGSDSPRDIEEALEMVNNLLDTWEWDSGRKFDDPPPLPTIIPEKESFPIPLCDNIEAFYDLPFIEEETPVLYNKYKNVEWLIDTAKKYDIRIPPEYANFRFDTGGFFDILPYLQKCFIELLKSHPDPDGGTCDYVEFTLFNTFRDIVGSNIPYFDSNWDEGGSFDTPKYLRWKDELVTSPDPDVVEYISVNDTEKNKLIKVRVNKDFDLGGLFDSFNEEIINIPTNLMGDISQNIHDTFGQTIPNQMDVGQSFDTMIPQSVIRDEFIIIISYAGKSISTTVVGGKPVSFDSGGNFDMLANLDLINSSDRIIEYLYSSVNAVSSTSTIILNTGQDELLSGQVNINSISNSIIFLGIPRVLSSSISLTNQIYSFLELGIFNTITSTVLGETKISEPNLIIGEPELLSGSSNISLSIEPNLTTGEISILSSVIINITNTVTELTLGVDEFIIGITNVSSTSIGDLLTINSLYNARSIVIDVQNNHGDLDAMALMGIRFGRFGSIINVGTPGVDFNAYATTTESSGSYAPWRLFYNTIGLTGTLQNWKSANTKTTNQRIVFNIGNGIALDEIIFYNYHASGTDTDKGIKNVRVYVSEDIITSTVYGSPISNSVLVYNGIIDQHTSINELDPQSITIGIYEGSSHSTSNVSTPQLDEDMVSGSSYINSNVSDISLITGDPEELSSSITFSSYINSVFIIGNGEVFESYVDVDSNVNATLSVPTILMTSIAPNMDTTFKNTNNVLWSSSYRSYFSRVTVNNSVLTLGSEDQLTGDINVISIVLGSLILGDFVTLSSSNSIISSTDAILTSGEPEILNGSININSNIDSDLIIGRIELTGGIVITNTNITSTLVTGLLELLASSSLNVSITVADLINGLVELMSSDISIITNVTDSTIDIGDNEELIGSSNINSNIDSILTQNDTILTGNSTSTSTINDILIVGTDEILSGTVISNINIVSDLDIRNFILEVTCSFNSIVVPNLTIGIVEIASSTIIITSNTSGLLISGDNEILSSNTNIYTTVLTTTIDFGIVEELSGSSVIVNSIISDLVTGDPEELSSNINIDTTVDNSLLLTGEDEILSAVDNIITSINANITMGVPVPLANTRINIYTNVSDVELVTGDPEELSGIINVTTDVISNLVFGENEVLSGTSNIISIIDSIIDPIKLLENTINITTNVSDSNLVTGDIEELSGITNTSTDVISNLVFGENEVLSGVSNSTTNIDSIIDIDMVITGSSVSISNSNSIFSIEGVIEILSGVSNSTTNIDSIIDMGDDEKLTGTANLITNVNVFTITIPENEILESTDKIKIYTDVIVKFNLVTGENEELSGASNSITFIYTNTINIGDNEELSGTSNLNTECDSVMFEDVTSFINLTTECDGDLVIGVIEITSASINLTTNVYDTTLNISFDLQGSISNTITFSGD